MSPPELALWMRLRQSSPGMPRFRRQHPIGRYIADFYCPAARLVIEIDGWSHAMGDQPARDEGRDRWFAANGYTVVRLSVDEVKADPNGVVDGLVRQAVALGQPPPSRR
jgi:very-short-patch-repair endonuclease